MIYIEDILKFILLSIILSAVVIAFVYGWVRLDEYDTDRRNKKECYEIYATDNVVLKRCNKYFEENNND